MKSPHEAGFWVAAWILGNLVLVGLFDLWNLYSIDPGNTASFYVQQWSRQNPLLPLTVGMILGHLFFGSVRVAGNGRLP